MSTVADRIRQMSDDELTLFLSRVAMAAFKMGARAIPAYAYDSSRVVEALRESLWRGWFANLQKDDSEYDWDIFTPKFGGSFNGKQEI